MPAARRAAARVTLATIRRSRRQSRKNSGVGSTPPGPRAVMASHNMPIMCANRSAGEAVGEIGTERGMNTNERKTRNGQAGQVLFRAAAAVLTTHEIMGAGRAATFRPCHTIRNTWPAEASR